MYKNLISPQCETIFINHFLRKFKATKGYYVI